MNHANSTSAGGAMCPEPNLLIAIGGAASVLGTAGAACLPSESSNGWRQEVHTNSGAQSLGDPEQRAHPIFELRRLTGLTWAHLARLLDVQPRSLHFWASRRPMTAANEERLSRLLAVMHRINRGSASLNRALLLSAGTGELVFDLLATGRYEDAIAQAGQGCTSPRSLSPLSQAARAARMPPAPQMLVVARAENIHRDEGVSRPARAVRVKT